MANYLGRLKDQELTEEELHLLESIPEKDVVSIYNDVKVVFSSRKHAEDFMREKADEFLNMYFDMNMEIPLNISSRLKSNRGLFYSTYTKNSKGFKNSSKPCKITLLGAFFDFEQDDIFNIMNVLYHECVHYALCNKGLRFSDSDILFDSILNKLCISSNYKPNSKPYNRDYDLYTCECKKSRSVFAGIKNPSNNVLNTCPECKKRLYFVRKEIGKYKDIKESFTQEVLVDELQSIV